MQGGVGSSSQQTRQYHQGHLKVKPGARTTAGLCGEVGAMAVSARAGAACGRAAEGEITVAGGMSYFISCRRYASAVGTAPQHTSSVLVLARTSCTRDGAGGFSVSRNHRSLKHTFTQQQQLLYGPFSRTAWGQLVQKLPSVLIHTYIPKYRHRLMQQALAQICKCAYRYNNKRQKN